MRFLVIALDPGIDNGAAVVMDDTQQLYFAATWESASDARPYFRCTEAANAVAAEIFMSRRISKYDSKLIPYVLVHEDVYVPMRIKKKSSGFLPGLEKREQVYSPTAAFELCKSIGIWTNAFVNRVYSVHVSKWRKNAGINQYHGTEECKRMSVEYAKLLLRATAVFSVNGGSVEIDHHIADAYHIGRYWTDKARLVIASGKDPVIHGVEGV